MKKGSGREEKIENGRGRGKIKGCVGGESGGRRLKRGMVDLKIDDNRCKKDPHRRG